MNVPPGKIPRAGESFSGRAPSMNSSGDRPDKRVAVAFPQGGSDMVLRRDLWGELARVQDEFQRLWNYRPQQPGLPVNLWADEQAVYAEVDLPDLDTAKLEVTVNDGNELTIQGERKAPDVANAVWVRQERSFGQFSRSLTLPVLIDADKVDARYADGVLKLTMPKHEAAKPRKIAVKA
jgi:HSP20 family protein